MDEINKVHHKNFLDNDLPDKSIQLLIADPPYFQVKGEFDFIWSSFDEYLKDVDRWVIECKRLLADNGTLFWYGDAKKIAYAQIILDKYFNLESNAVVHIYDRQTNKIRPEDSLSFINVSERLLMYSNGSDYHDNVRISIKYVQDYLLTITNRNELAELLLLNGNCKNIESAKQNANNILNQSSAKPQLITEYQYNLIANKNKKEYEDLRREYEDLRREYEDLRRAYFPTEEYKTEILRFSQEGHKTGKYDHDTVKPELLSRYLIRTCSRKGDNVCVPFAGSGTECAMSKKEGRPFWGYDIEKKYVDMANQRCYFEQPTLF